MIWVGNPHMTLFNCWWHGVAQWQVVIHQLSVYAGNGPGKGPYYCHSAYQVHQANVGPVFDPCDGFDMPPITSQREHKLK